MTVPFEQTTPCQSQGAEGVVGDQPESAPRGSWRESLKEVRASISVRVRFSAAA